MSCCKVLCCIMLAYLAGPANSLGLMSTSAVSCMGVCFNGSRVGSFIGIGMGENRCKRPPSNSPFYHIFCFPFQFVSFLTHTHSPHSPFFFFFLFVFATYLPTYRDGPPRVACLDIRRDFFVRKRRDYLAHPMLDDARERGIEELAARQGQIVVVGARLELAVVSLRHHDRLLRVDADDVVKICIAPVELLGALPRPVDGRLPVLGQDLRCGMAGRENPGDLPVGPVHGVEAVKHLRTRGRYR